MSVDPKKGPCGSHYGVTISSLLIDRKYGPGYGLPNSCLHEALKINDFSGCMAERVGFEPTVRFPAHTLSKRAP
jgi:hypothetical protein